jgi:peptidoglycan/xylan/chitin deacetylase (PgdA/CDA1 family)
MPKLAFTLDDAPSVQEPGVPLDPARMDRCRKVLSEWGVKHCVAFVVGSRCEGHEAVLERWLDAGFELANHTHWHRYASQLTEREFADDVARCDELLTRAGAFEGGRTKWFRFPHLDRGRDARQRQRRAALCEQLGYRQAPASIELLDYLFEAQLVAALRRGDAYDAVRVEQRFLNVCLTTLREKAAWAEAQTPALPLIGYAHFGQVAERNLAGMLHLLRAYAFELCPLEEAAAHPVHAAFNDDFARSGLVLPNERGSLRQRLTQRIAALTERLDWFDQRRYGPLLRRY